MTRSEYGACLYEYDGTIHRFTIVRAVPAAVDEFLSHLETILDETPPSQSIRILMDLRPEGLPPLGHTLMRLKTFFSLQSRPRAFKSAYLYQRGTLMTMLPTLLNMLRQRATRRFFGDNEEAEAIAWLMED